MSSGRAGNGNGRKTWSVNYMREYSAPIDPNRKATRDAYERLRLAHDHILRAAQALGSGRPEGLMWEGTLMLRGKLEALATLADDCRTMAADMAFSYDWRGE